MIKPFSIPMHIAVDHTGDAMACVAKPSASGSFGDETIWRTQFDDDNILLRTDETLYLDEEGNPLDRKPQNFHGLKPGDCETVTVHFVPEGCTATIERKVKE